VIETPARPKADSPWSRLLGPEAICVCGGDLNIETGELTGGRVVRMLAFPASRSGA
jgi:hypothetical protein